MATSTLIQPSSAPSRPAKLAISPISAPSPSSIASPGSGAQTPTGSHPLAIKPSAGSPGVVAAAAAVVAQGPKSITSKEWVVPPRPKPGRKPATDTPPTKRKAQNRAAQRAFRERRAARVGELEEQLDEYREEHERIEDELRERAKGLETKVTSLQGRCSMLEDMLERERAENGRMAGEIEAMRRQQMEEASTRHDSSSRYPGRPQASLHHAPRNNLLGNPAGHRNSAISISQIISPPDPSPDDGRMTDVGCGACDPAGTCACVEEILESKGSGDLQTECGNCSIGTKCACLEAALGGTSTTIAEPDLKRGPSSPAHAAPTEKRHKSISVIESTENENEIDFTAMFSRKKQPPVETAAIFEPLPPPILIPPRDSCGFCKEGTYCMCAEAAAAAASQPTLAPLGNHSQVQTPPPSENDVGIGAYEVTATGAVKLPSLFGRDRQNKSNRSATAAASKGGCGPNGPGSCAQCLSDPKSGLFCRSLAANFDRQGGKSGGGCCGGNAGGGGCCKSGGGGSPKPAAGASTSRPSGSPAVSLSCADAYKTLSSHRNFEKAADDIGTWLPKLRATPLEIQDDGRGGDGYFQSNRAAGRGGGRGGRCPIEVETASIMSVLKGFDVRFGREA